jgi:hypothetical protein
VASDYQYLTPAEFAAFDLSVSGITNAILADKHISAAEKVVDAWCGHWTRFYPNITLTPTLVSGLEIRSSTFGEGRPVDYWAKGGLYLEVYDGPGTGQARLITASSGLEVTIVSGWDTAPVVGSSKMMIKQRSRFPRWLDWDARIGPFVPEEVKHATAAQVAFAVRHGNETAGLWDPSVVEDTQGNIQTRSYGTGYSETRDTRRTAGQAVWIAPQARLHLKGFVHGSGRIAE